MTKFLIIIIIILLILIYYNHYKRYNTDYNIIQLFLEQLTLELLNERNPIIIYDRIVNPEILFETLFKYSFIFKKKYYLNNNNFIQNTKSKYTLLLNPNNNVDINIISPIHNSNIKYNFDTIENSNINFITIKLKKQQILILPPFWNFNIKKDDYLVIYRLDDIISNMF